MQSILLVTFPFFVLVLCGYVATRRVLLMVALFTIATVLAFFSFSGAVTWLT